METNKEDFQYHRQRRFSSMNERSDAKNLAKTSFFNLTHQCLVFVSIGLILALSGSISITIIHFNAEHFSNSAKSIDIDDSYQISENESFSENFSSNNSSYELNITKVDNNLAKEENVSILSSTVFLIT